MAWEPFIPLSDLALLQDFLHAPQLLRLDLLTRHFGIPLGRGDLRSPNPVPFGLGAINPVSQVSM
jgi:hypothetical protein